MKTIKDYQRWADHNRRSRRNIFRNKNGECKTTKGIRRCYVYYETFLSNLLRVLGEILCSLQKIDQGLIQQKCYGPLRAIKFLCITMSVFKKVLIEVFHFSMFKIPLGLVTLRWATASSRLNSGAFLI